MKKLSDFLGENLHNDEIPIQEIYQEQNSEEIDNNDPILIAEGEHPLEEEEERELNDEEEKEPSWEEFEAEWRPNWLGEYLLQPGISQIPSDVQTPLQYFSLFFHNEIYDMLVDETNRYANQFFEANPDRRQTQYYKDWTNCTKAQIQGYIGILIHMGLLKLPQIDYHWRKDSLFDYPHYALILLPD